jgi:phosphoribosylglycinamide formyltransferase-1
MLKKLAVFASGSGTDFQSLIDAIECGYIDNAVIDVLIAGKPGIGAIERAIKHGIDYKVFFKGNYSSPENMNSEIVDFLRGRGVDLIVLAGYLNILTPNIVRAYEGRIVNIHPSLIPRHSGIGYYGMRVHQSVIASGDKESGATVHFVDEGTDTGNIIMQERVPVLPGDTPETLRDRVLALEHQLLPKAVKYICNKF